MEKQQHQNPGGKGTAASGGQGVAEGPAPKDTDLDEIREKFRIVKVRHCTCVRIYGVMANSNAAFRLTCERTYGTPYFTAACAAAWTPRTQAQ